MGDLLDFSSKRREMFISKVKEIPVAKAETEFDIILITKDRYFKNGKGGIA